MSLVDILFNAAGGGVLGSALHCVTDYFDTKNKVTLMNAQINAAEKTEAWKAFAESQKDGGLQAIPSGVPDWVATIYVLVEAFKNVMRPLLALTSICIIAYVYSAADAEGRKMLQSEVIFGSFTAVFWYFGARYSRSTK